MCSLAIRCSTRAAADPGFPRAADQPTTLFPPPSFSWLADANATCTRDFDLGLIYYGTGNAPCMPQFCRVPTALPSSLHFPLMWRRRPLVIHVPRLQVCLVRPGAQVAPALPGFECRGGVAAGGRRCAAEGRRGGAGSQIDGLPKQRMPPRPPSCSHPPPAGPAVRGADVRRRRPPPVGRRPEPGKRGRGRGAHALPQTLPRQECPHSCHFSACCLQALAIFRRFNLTLAQMSVCRWVQARGARGGSTVALRMVETCALRLPCLPACLPAARSTRTRHGSLFSSGRITCCATLRLWKVRGHTTWEGRTPSGMCSFVCSRASLAGSR